MPETNAAVEILTIPCLEDNYVFLMHDPSSGATAVVDVPDPAPVEAALASQGWTLTDILITHHHWDHIDGVEPLRAKTGATVWGAAADAGRLPKLDHALAEGDVVKVGTLTGTVFDVSGHSVGHIAYHFAAAQAVFTGDSLMALGCGRLFEGTPEMMWASMQKLRALPGETMVYSGHEYTQTNARFALTIEPGNADLTSRSAAVDAARAQGLATVPSLLSEECKTNPYLRADLPELAAAIGMDGAAPDAVFAEVRGRKDRF